MRVNDRPILHAARAFDSDLARRLSDGVVSHMDLTRASQILLNEKANYGWNSDGRRLHMATALFEAVRAQHTIQHPHTTNREERKDAGGGWNRDYNREWNRDWDRSREPGWGHRHYPPPPPPPPTDREMKNVRNAAIAGGAALLVLGLIAKELDHSGNR